MPDSRLSPRTRIAWIAVSTLVGALASVQLWRTESRSVGTAMGDTYYLAVLSFAPMAFIAWFCAGAIMLARKVGYRGTWYLVPQAFAMVMICVKTAAWFREKDLPMAAASHWAAIPLTPVRSALLAFEVVSAIGCLLASGVCMLISYRYSAERSG